MFRVEHGMQCVMETADGIGPVRTYAWGLDVAGRVDMADSPFVSMAGAGGVGGLLAAYDFSEAYCYAYDGNGNVMAMVDASGDVAAEYRYGPYGQTRTATEAGIANPFRFSTKFLETSFASENETLSFGTSVDLYDYGFRWYHAGLGRWTARDPIEEWGGINIYLAFRNSPMSNWDLLGLTSIIDILKAFWVKEEDDPGVEGIWIMGEDDEYTDRVAEWDPVEKAAKRAAEVAAKNPGYWETDHMTNPNWIPGRSRAFDFARVYIVPANNPPGTSPKDVRNAVLKYKETGQVPGELWTSSIGSFTIGVTADEINRDECTMVLNIWMLNEMSEESFSFGGFFSGYPMPSQWMWWNWRRELKYDAKGIIIAISPLPPGQGGGSNPNWPPPPSVPPGPWVPPRNYFGWLLGWWW